jgi:hypothetical protein
MYDTALSKTESNMEKIKIENFPDYKIDRSIFRGMDMCFIGSMGTYIAAAKKKINGIIENMKKVKCN